MKPKVILTNQTLKITCKVRDINGDLSDPSHIRFVYLIPDESELTYVYPGSAGPSETVGTVPEGMGNKQIIKEAVGIYYIYVEVYMTGKHKYTWETYGNNTASYKSSFQVAQSRWTV
jgi:hypothetical protein